MAYSLTPSETKTIWNRLVMGEAHNKRELRAMMKRGLDLYKGRHWPNMDVEQKYARIVINYVMHVIETRGHSITFRYPRFVIEAATEDAMNQKTIVARWVKYPWKKGRVQDELRRQAKDKEIFGKG